MNSQEDVCTDWSYRIILMSDRVASSHSHIARLAMQKCFAVIIDLLPTLSNDFQLDYHDLFG